MGWLSRFFPVRSLDGVGRGASCVLAVDVVSPDTIESTIAPVRGAALRWTLLHEETRDAPARSGGGRSSRLHAFASGWRGGPLLVRASCGRTIEVSLERARLSAPIDPDDGVPLGTSPAAASAYAALLARVPPGAGPLYVREHVVASGQRIVLRGRVEPVPPGSYRDPASRAVDFRATGELTIEDPVLGPPAAAIDASGR